jgi:1-acyl-sn-glycerol-3-phosphate acyltransferase
MRRLPLADELPYRFRPPRLSRFWYAASRPVLGHMLRRQQRVHAIEFQGVEHLEPLLARGDGVLIAPNHPDHADCGVVFALSRRLRRPFCYMAAHQIFAGGAGFNRFVLPRLGVFPVDREGADRAAYQAGVEILAGGRNPLVVFPEGEIYHQADRLTPLREGAAALAMTASRKAADRGRNVWVVPAAIKYRFLDGYDPLPDLAALMSELEARFTWQGGDGRNLIERMYRYAEGMLALKEIEYLGRPSEGSVKERVVGLRSAILERIEAKWAARPGLRDPIPVRVKELRRACLKALAEPEAAEPRKAETRRDLHDLFVVIQLFSYPGDYVRECPTCERLAEILTKFEQDSLDVDRSLPRGPRRAILRLGEPIDLRSRLEGGGRKRDAVGSLTTELERRIQGLLDEIGPGRPLPDAAVAGSPPRAESAALTS